MQIYTYYTYIEIVCEKFRIEFLDVSFVIYHTILILEALYGS